MPITLKTVLAACIGKTLVFCLPMILISLQEEMRMPLVRNEGPIGLIICPSRELARQTHEVINGYLDELKKSDYPPLRCVLCMGGIDMRLQMDEIRQGVHMVVATPGRLKVRNSGVLPFFKSTRSLELVACACFSSQHYLFAAFIEVVMLQAKYVRWKTAAVTC